MNYQALLVILGLLAMIPITKWAFSESAAPNVVKLAIRALLTGAIFALGVYLFIQERTFNRTAKTTTGVLMPDIVKKTRTRLAFWKTTTFDVKYVFRVADTSLTGHDTVSLLPSHPAITVYYNPSDPTKNCVEKEALWPYVLTMLIGGLGFWVTSGIHHLVMARLVMKSFRTGTTGPPSGARRSFVIAQHGTQTGPFTIDELRHLWTSGAIGEEALYRVGESQEWLPIHKLHEALNRNATIG